MFEVDGELVLGEDVWFCDGPISTQVAVGQGGVCRLDDGVYVAHGASISCDLDVRIGPRTRLGPFVMVYDSDFHAIGAHDLRNEPDPAEVPPKMGPVRIGADVLIGEGATILRGTTIGDAAVIDPGTVVWGEVAAGARVTGRPGT